MNKAEKRYFHRFAQRHVLGKENQYFVLYTEIQKQEIYDEEAIKKLFPGIKQFSVQKNYLYHLILRSLRAFAQESKKEFKLRAQLDNIEILFSRGLIDQCAGQIQRLKKTLLANEFVHLMPELFKWERKVLKAQSPGNLAEKLKVYSRERMRKLEALSSEMTLLDLYDEMVMLLRESQRGTRQESDPRAGNILRHPLVAHPPQETTFIARQARLFIHAYGHQMKEQFHEAYPYYLQVLELWNQNPAQISAQTETYSRILAGYLNICHLTNQHDNLAPMVKRIRSIPNLSPDIQAKVFAMTYNQELLYYMNYGHFTEARNLIPDLIAGLKKYGDKIDSRQVLVYYYNIAVLHFVLQEYSHALRYVNSILGDYGNRIQNPFVRFARILHMVLHFELKNEDLLISLIRSFTRNVKGANQLNVLETKVIQLLRNLERQFDNRARTLLFREFDREMEALYKIHGPRMLGLGELASWAESKATHRSIMEVIQKKTEAWHAILSG